MPSMFRRFLRIFCVIGMVVIVGAAIAALFWQILVITPRASFGVGLHGLVITNVSGQWHAYCIRESTGSVKELLEWPKWSSMGRVVKAAYVPWWLLLTTWGLLTALIWRLARRRKLAGSFPIEPTAAPK